MDTIVKGNNVKRVLTLLDDDELTLYEHPLDAIYKENGFISVHVLIALTQ